MLSGAAGSGRPRSQKRSIRTDQSQMVTGTFEVIRDLNREGVSVLLVEQNARLALKLAHRGYVMETGTITTTDRAEVLLNDPRIQAAYLGE